MEEINEVTLTLRIDRELHRKLKKYSVSKGLPMKYIISELVKDHLTEKGCIENG